MSAWGIRLGLLLLGLTSAHCVPRRGDTAPDGKREEKRRQGQQEQPVACFDFVRRPPQRYGSESEQGNRAEHPLCGGR